MQRTRGQAHLRPREGLESVVGLQQRRLQAVPRGGQAGGASSVAPPLVGHPEPAVDRATDLHPEWLRRCVLNAGVQAPDLAQPGALAIRVPQSRTSETRFRGSVALRMLTP